MEYKKVTAETIDELLNKNILKLGHFFLTKHYLVIRGEHMATQTYNYLFNHNYTSTMEYTYFGKKAEFGIIDINS